MGEFDNKDDIKKMIVEGLANRSSLVMCLKGLSV